MANALPMLDVGAAPTDEGIKSLYSKYYDEDPYLKKVEEAKKKRDELIAAYKGTLAGAAQVEGAEPSKAERYFRLAQAFLTPGQTGDFTESLGQAGKVAAELEKEKRLARRQQAIDALKAATTGQQLDIEAAGADVDLYSKLLERNAVTRGNLTQQLMEQSMKPREAQSPAGKQAVDEGLIPGTPEFHRRVAEIASRSGDVAEQRLQLALANAAAAEARATRQGSEMSRDERQLLSETEDTLFSKQESKGLLTEALRLNPDTYDSSISDTIARFSAEGFQPDHPRVINTRDLENILKTQLLTSLKSTFGAAPTEGERAVLAELQGIDAKSKPERERIMRRALALVDARIKRDEARLQKIREGHYRYRGI